MGDVLSQEEVDSLLSGIDSGEVETEANALQHDGKAEVYDFRKEGKPIQGSIPAFKIISERFVGRLQADLSATTGVEVEGDMEGVESVRYDELCRSLPLPTSLNLFRMEPLRGLCMLVIEGNLVFGFIDALLGGKCERYVKLEGREFTSIENRIIQRITKTVLAGYESAWAEVYKVKTDFVRSEVDPQFTGVAQDDEIVLAVKYGISVRNFSGTLTICIPYSTVEPIKKKLIVGYQNEIPDPDPRWRRDIAENVRRMTVKLAGILGTARINGKQLLELKKDDVIQLDQKTREPMIVNAGGVPKFKAFSGTLNKRKAIKLGGTVEEG
jgi:flagellar motor switch protein FliM